MFEDFDSLMRHFYWLQGTAILYSLENTLYFFFLPIPRLAQIPLQYLHDNDRKIYKNIRTDGNKKKSFNETN